MLKAYRFYFSFDQKGIFGEQKLKLTGISNKFFNSFTFFDSYGMWEGKINKGGMIETISQDIKESDIQAYCSEIKEALRQDIILVTSTELKSINLY